MRAGKYGRGTIKRAAGALIGYGASKSSVLVAPLMLSSILPLSEYGLFEYSLSIAQLLSVVLSIGMHNGVPYFLLRRNQSVYAPAFSLHVIGVSIICLVASALAQAANRQELRLIAIICGILVAQFFSTARYQSAGRPGISSVSESSVYLIVLGFAIASRLSLIGRNFAMLGNLLTAYLVLVLIWNIATFPWSTTRLRLWRTYRSAAIYGSKMIPATFANVGLVSLGRTLVGISGSLEQVAVYSIAYRMCIPLVAIHQFLTNFYFRKIYASAVKEFERYFTYLSVLLFGGALLMYSFGPDLGVRLIGFKAVALSAHRDLFLLMSFVMISWAQLSLMELFMNREAKTLIQLPGLLAGAGVTALGLLMSSWRRADAVVQITIFQGLGFIVAVLWQFRVSGVSRPRWPVARSIVIAQAVVIISVWLYIAIAHSVTR